MRRFLTLTAMSVLLATEVSAQAPGSGTRPAFGGLTRQTTGGSATGASPVRPNTTTPATRPNSGSAFVPAEPPGETAGVMVQDDVVQPRAFGNATPSRPNNRTASQFQQPDAATQPPSFDRGLTDAAHAADATEHSGIISSTPRSLSGTTSTRQPAAARAVSPRTSTPAEAASPVAEMVLSQALQPRLKQELPGQPLALSQVFERTTGSGQRIKAVQTYWKLVAKMAAYHAALDDRQMLQSVNVRQMAQHDRATLAAAQLSAAAAVHRAELECVVTQNELIEAALLADVDQLPVPSDVPVVSEYRTQFHAMYGERAAPPGLRRLDRALPYHLKDVRAQADALVAAQLALQSTAEAASSGEASVTTLIEVQRMLARERVAFMSAVFDYNAIIAEYAMHVAPGTQSRDTLTSMLIKSRPTATARTVNPRSASLMQDQGEIQPVTAQETIVHEEILAADTAADSAPDLQEPAHRFAMPAKTSSRQPARYQVADEQEPPQQPSRFRMRDEDQLQPQPQVQFQPSADEQPQLIPAGNYPE